ncbi:MAG: sigma-70 family RNA polymerase sigma factor [Armatimonadota bacterium]|nr:sigma-70 family RNA polymerase sigma factor [Armatimonadota bacterium]MDR5675338.1 sigma-70 family RNA polymerase sigma factor [Armatimonadota bacterium]MDR5689032.1 sigma-70 family RNA polymerase sigma factor [Armatimonadota bacterium]MDR7385809.1 sigma-70 family RNA polymerase sigma factor [Armatimonadota bacterium]MDR7388389.1 sigma-70 family RNA polymerase sigma factor [Armatimonadota bacterium]
MDEDERLVRAFRAGEASAFAALVIKYREPVYRFLRRMTGNHEDAADLTQEVFLRAYRSLGRFQGRCRVKTWLLRIATNACLDHRARQRDPLPLEAVAGLASPPETGPDARAERRERWRLVAEAVQALPPRQRAAVVLRLYGGYTYAEIAEIMDCSEGTVKATMFAALRKLRVVLGPLVEG